ncbi:MAG TPA: SAM-dependent chlorinase/fluorinase [Gemmatimonadaceae bacterium]|nr:SAM-dependent chlorinase/fluorinase [Gemmatimonadaceae bacterium]
MSPLVTLLTDFGTADGYVAEMKGVLLTLAPQVRLVDASHELPPQDVEYARLALARYWRRFPVGTIHVVVVDPGVGSARRAIAVASDGRLLVGPDNGVLSPALLLPGARAVTLPTPAGASATFHGRDLFAPAAARLAAGATLEALGDPCDDPIVRRTPEAHRLDDGAVLGEVIAVDRFGNLITNLLTTRGGTVEIAGERLAVRRTYADVAPGALLALVGSSGLLEVALREGSAARRLGVGRGAAVRLLPPG